MERGHLPGRSWRPCSQQAGRGKQFLDVPLMRYSQITESEAHEYQGTEPEIRDFVAWVFEKLHIPGDAPEIEFSSEKESDDQNRTGYYDIEGNHMWIYTGNRNLIDIMRTIAHELSHHKQRTTGDTNNGAKLSELEGQADQAAGILMKLWVRKHPEIIQ